MDAGVQIMPNNPSEFSHHAVSAFERTYTALFKQAHTEVSRLDRVNVAMAILEQSLLDPDRIAQMEPAQQIALAELLLRTSNGTISNLTKFGQLFMNIRSVVGLLDGVQRFTGSTQEPALEDRSFPGLPSPVSNGGNERR